MLTFPDSLERAFSRNPVVAALYGREQLIKFLDSTSDVCIIANVALQDLGPLVGALSANDKFAFVNIDSCSGLAQDKGAVEYLKKIGAPGIVTTRVSLIQKANSLGMVTMQKVFVTDRSNLPRSVTAVEQSRPHLVQLMPWPVVPYIEKEELRALSPFIVGGFVAGKSDVAAALAAGAKGVSTSDIGMWVRREA
ncbi:glycerol-3-phosphate responsive antiterminator [Saxibacter everestensis]|uniref:Glycerol-3-phosphate responsive antiterminator n=1 Tax=Saxibacter everestensis TaxID=2909229 RepID=A0ABY8QR83_9MICO|nr:glycerol-3-phosphate responsive antiterminator [Brevibacteriaceae bacterium ZFBP1038]